MTDEVKVISQPKILLHPDHHGLEDDATRSADFAEALENDYLHAANEEAKVIIEQAHQKAHELEAEAEQKIEQWWQENQQELEVVKIDATHQGYEEGYLKGKLEAEAEVRQAYEEKFAKAQQIIDQAYVQKEEIIAEAEPFLLELSTTIATQIVRQELTSYPEKFVELIQQHILRFKEKEYITICVHPDDFDYIQSQRAHLVSVVNGDTEIKIIPDHSVTAKGVVVRTAYGSIDARIDTQIEEIKKAILEVGRE